MRALVALAAVLTASPALALDINSFRAQNGKLPLSPSSALAGVAYEQAQAMAGRRRIDHDNYRSRVSGFGSTSAENVLSGCADEDCAIRGWAKSAGHRKNMLRGDVSKYGIASATDAKGRRYWALELGNE